MTPTVILVGPPGAGKTTVGQQLAKKLNVSFRDTDEDIEHNEKMSVADIFVTQSEAHFRELEHAAVLAALETHEGVLSLGGGAIMHDQTREALGDQRVIFLDVGLSAAVKRVGMNQQRPLLLGSVRGQLKQLMDKRRPHYRQVARYEVLTDDLSPQQITEKINAWLDQT